LGKKKRNQSLRSVKDSRHRKKLGSTDWTDRLINELKENEAEPEREAGDRKRRKGKRDNAKRLRSDHI
jgi:hypothetical protein